jgi:ADP-ribose pyrophosphatase YjhB (NUDIX family)
MQPDGPTDLDVDAVVITDGERPGVATLMAQGWWPPQEQITQASGVCFTDDGGVVLVAIEPHQWTLPGGTLEPGESAQDALVREIAEEACAAVLECDYIASQHIWDPDKTSEPRSYYQSRWWAHVRLVVWDPHDESVDRIVVRPEAFLNTLCWREKTIARRLLALALDIRRHQTIQ